MASLSGSGADISISLGRDILLYGDFEDEDVDADQFETVRWDSSGTAGFGCQAWAYQSAQAMCLTRSANNSSDALVSFRNRVRVMGDAIDEVNKDLTLVAYLRGDNADEISIVSRYYPSSGSGNFGEERALHHAGGSFDWQMVHSDLNMPGDLPEFDASTSLNPRALRLFLRHSPMASGVGLAVFDELAVVSWEERQTLNTSAQFATPHARDFLRIKAAPGAYEFELMFTKYVSVAGDS